MKVWQYSSHLLDERGARVDDWTWRQTRRRLGVLVRLASPYRARDRARGRHARRLHRRRAAPAVPREARSRRRHRGARPGDAHARRRRVLRRRRRRVRAVRSARRTSRAGSASAVWPTCGSGCSDHLQRLSLGYYERNRTGAIVSRITNDVEALDQLVTDGISSLVQNTLVLVGTVIVLFLLDWRLALATLIVLPLMGLATAWFRSRSNHAYRRVRERLGVVTATLAEDISGMRVVQSFTREPTSQSTFRGVNERYRESNYETVILNGLYFPAVDILSSVATAIVLGVGGWLVVEDEMTVGTLLAFTLYLANFFDPVQQLSQLYNTFLSATAALDRITAVLDEEPDIVDSPDAVRAAPHRGPRPLRPRPLRLRRPPGRPARLRPRRPCGHDGRARRTHGRGKVHDRQAARALLRPARRADHDRRHRPTRRHPGVAAPPARDRPAGRLPLRRLDRRQRRLRPARRHPRRDRSGRGRRRSRRVRRRSPRRLRHARSASAASSSRSASGSSSRSREPSSQTRASSSSTRPPRRSTSAPSGGSTAGCVGSSPAGPRSSSPTACRRSAAQTSSSCSTTDASSTPVRTTSWSAVPGPYRELYGDWAAEVA